MRSAFTEPELLSQKSEHVFDKKIGHKHPNDRHSYHDEIELYQEISKRYT